MSSFSNESNFSAPHLVRPSKDEEPKSKLSCFGNPDKVTPKNSEGLIEPNQECVLCEYVSSCLSEALQKQGILSPSPVNRFVGFLRRWSERKIQSQSKR
jgi:hypothetical protein